jgi:hypothetical protein
MKFAKWIYIALLTYFSAEILWRRWIWQQIPTQVSAALVYSVLAVNGIVLVVLLSRPTLAKHFGRPK